MPLRVQTGMHRGRNGQDTQIIHGPDGYSYHGNKLMKGGRLYVRCYRYYSFRCHGAASIDPTTGDFRRCTRHTHRPDRLLMHERRLRHAVLDRCRTDALTTLNDIYHEERLRLRIPDLAAANVTFKQLRPAMLNARSEGLPRIPHTLTDLGNILFDQQNEHLTRTLDGRDSLLAGVVGHSDRGTRAILFFSRRMLRYLGTVKSIFSDGTFVIPPDLECSQIWVLCTVRRHHLIVIGWALMQRKTTRAYVCVLNSLHQLQPRFQPTEVMCDFEQGEQAAWNIVFPNATRHGCHVHHSRKVGDMAKTLGLHHLLQENRQADDLVRSLSAIPLLRTEEMLPAFEAVVDRADRLHLEALGPMMDYYLRTWLSPARLRVLSVNGCPDRTNNVCESHNRTLRAQVRVLHPNIYHLISALVRYEDKTKVTLVPLEQGRKFRSRRISTLLSDEMIQGLTEDLAEGNINYTTFLRRASRRMQGVFNLNLN